MLLLAARPLAEQKDCIMIGDRPEDKGAADACGIKFFWASVLRNEQEGVEKCQIRGFMRHLPGQSNTDCATSLASKREQRAVTGAVRCPGKNSGVAELRYD